MFSLWIFSVLSRFTRIRSHSDRAAFWNHKFSVSFGFFLNNSFLFAVHQPFSILFIFIVAVQWFASLNRVTPNKIYSQTDLSKTLVQNITQLTECSWLLWPPFRWSHEFHAHLLLFSAEFTHENPWRHSALFPWVSSAY